MPKVVCSGYLTKNPTSGGRGRWRLRWVELVDGREEGGNLMIQYSTSEKKRKSPLGVVLLETCVGIRELRGGSNTRYTSAFSFMFTDRSDLILSSLARKEVLRWMKCVRGCGVPILVSIAGADTLTRSISESNLQGGGSSGETAKNEVDWTTRRLPASPPLPFRHEHKQTKQDRLSSYAVVLDDDPYKKVGGGHYYSRMKFAFGKGGPAPSKQKHKRLSQPLGAEDIPTLLVEPSPNLIALKLQLQNFKHIKVVTTDKLRVSSQLAKGAFGPICGAKLDGVPVAVKKLELTRSEEEEMVFLREAFIISQFNHPNIVKVLGVVFEGQRMLVLELLSPQSLKEHIIKKYQIGKLDAADMVSFSYEVALGMKHMHTMGYIHKRLRASHVLMTSDLKHCKIAGFSESPQKSEQVSTSSGDKLTANSNEIWMAIESLKKRQFSYQSDTWSYGILLYEIWSVGRLPYKDFTAGKLVEFLNKFHCVLPPPGCPREIYKIMLQCLSHKPSNRPSWSAILDMLQTPDLMLTVCADGCEMLPPESLKLGSANLNTQLLYGDLQNDYSEVQRQQLAEVLKSIKKGNRMNFHTIAGRSKEDSRYYNFNALREMFAQAASKEDTAANAGTQRASSLEKNDRPKNGSRVPIKCGSVDTGGAGDFVMKKNTSYNKLSRPNSIDVPPRQSSMGDDEIFVMDKNTSYSKLPSDDSDALDLYESLIVSDDILSMLMTDGYLTDRSEASPPTSLDPSGIMHLENADSPIIPALKLSRSCESLLQYESEDTKDTAKTRRKGMTKATSLSAAIPSVRPARPIAVHRLVSQFEALSPAPSPPRPLSANFGDMFCEGNNFTFSPFYSPDLNQRGHQMAVNNSETKLRSQSVGDCIDVDADVVATRPLSLQGDNFDASYESVSGYELAPTKGTLQSFLPTTLTPRQ